MLIGKWAVAAGVGFVGSLRVYWSVVKGYDAAAPDVCFKFGGSNEHGTVSHKVADGPVVVEAERSSGTGGTESWSG